ncbi:DinB family protein [Halorubrum sp. DTA98]|uniref:DinB family protein n=1 Tax=Halorubrum sp. DTA98 TaxID=3402163 RepID=UPI003AABD30B
MSTADTHLYWATGCTSCLRVKEFLERNGVEFVSHNVVGPDAERDPTDPSPIGVQGADPEIIEEMTELGLPGHVPVVRVGDDWADGKDIPNVADLVGIEHEAEPLPVEELGDRLDTMLSAALRYLELIPESELSTDIPNRPRSYGELIQHVFSLPDVFMMHEAGVPMDGVPRMDHDWDPHSTVALDTYGRSVRGRFRDWIEGPGSTTDWSETADVFWGQPTKHEFFERTTWHTGQHVRQLEWILEHELDVGFDDPIDPALWEGLPMPRKVWNE